jgi:hypothetical protein
VSKLQEFEKDLAQVINRHSLDAYTGVADCVLAEYVMNCIEALQTANLKNWIHQPPETSTLNATKTDGENQ